MSKYTTEVRYICETAAGLVDSEGYSSIDEILTTAAPVIFNFDYPIFDEAYRIPLEKKILKHFYTREICEETVGLWKLRLDDKMNVIMPYFNQLYNSELIKFNPMWDTDIKTSHAGNETGVSENSHDYTQKTESRKSNQEGFNEDTENKNKTSEMGTKNATFNKDEETVNSGTSSNATTSNGIETHKDSSESIGEHTNAGNNIELYSDTPQGSINNIDKTISSAYLTNATKNENEGTDNTISVGENTSNRESENITTSNGIEKTENSVKSNNTENVVDNSLKINDGNTSRTGSKIGNEEGVTDYSNIGTGNSNFNNTNQYIESIVGKRGYGSYSKMLLEFRDTFLNIDAMILDALETLFISLW